MNEVLYNAYVKILKEELLPAMGCTEPIAVAYAAALVRKTLGTIPQSAEVHVSANIIKNVKSVVVPHTGGMRGIDAAVAAGIIAGNADRGIGSPVRCQRGGSQDNGALSEADAHLHCSF